MPTPPLRGLALLAVAVLLAACGTPAQEERDADLAERDAQDAQIEQLRAQIADLEAEVERLRDQGPEPPGDEPDPDSPPQPAGPRTPEGLVEQLHAAFGPDPALGFEPAPTEWEPAAVPDGFGEGQAAFDSAGELMTALAAELAGSGLGDDAWEVTTRVLFDQAEGDPDADAATGAVLLWGFLDDSVAGSDHRFALQRGPDGWFAASAEERARCARGVSPEDNLCV